jgi:hypothetical protein
MLTTRNPFLTAVTTNAPKFSFRFDFGTRRAAFEAKQHAIDDTFLDVFAGSVNAPKGKETLEMPNRALAEDFSHLGAPRENC